MPKKTTENASKVYFPNLNGLRITAALLVVVHHIEQIKSFFNLPTHWQKLPAINLIGKLGVVLFFVLSGFLITYLLLIEKRDTNSISIKDFYIRRVLRIWPLYLIVIICGLYILPNIELLTIPIFNKEYAQHKLGLKSLFYFLFLSNVALPFFKYMPHISQTWSIGVEEQFYLIWPLLFKKLKTKKYYVLFGFIAIYLLINISLYYLPEFTFKGFLIIFWEDHFNIDCMAIGALYALVYFNKQKQVLEFIYNRTTQLLVFSITVFLMSQGFSFPFLNYEIYATLFGIIILNLATNPKVIITLENRWSNYLGKISYGVYMYHPVMIVLSIKVLLMVNLAYSFLIYMLAIGSTIFISFFSYQIIEKKLIKLKVNFSKVVSGENAKGLTVTMDGDKSSLEENRA